MKITEQIVGSLNAGLSDLYFEFGVLNNLVEFELNNADTVQNIAAIDISGIRKKQEEIERISKIEDETKLTVEDIDVVLTESEEETLEVVEKAIKLISAMDEIGVKNEGELRTLLSKKLLSGTDTPSIDKAITDIRSKAAIVIQVDRVVEGLSKLGLSEKSKKEIDKIKNKELTKLMDVLLVKVGE